MLSLGTVQFRMPYGATNRKGKPSEAEVREIVGHLPVVNRVSSRDRGIVWSEMQGTDEGLRA